MADHVSKCDLCVIACQNEELDEEREILATNLAHLENLSLDDQVHVGRMDLLLCFDLILWFVFPITCSLLSTCVD